MSRPAGNVQLSSTNVSQYLAASSLISFIILFSNVCWNNENLAHSKGTKVRLLDGLLLFFLLHSNSSTLGHERRGICVSFLVGYDTASQNTQGVHFKTTKLSSSKSFVFNTLREIGKLHYLDRAFLTTPIPAERIAHLSTIKDDSI